MEEAEHIKIQKTKTFKFVLWKSYFDKGYSWLSFPKYVIFLIGFGDTLLSGGDNITRLIIGATIYAFICFFLGRVLYLRKFVDAEFEIGNCFNPYVKEMRNSKIFKDKPTQ